MPTITDNPAPLTLLPTNDPGRFTDDGKHYADIVGGLAAWRLVVSSNNAAGTFTLTRPSPVLAVLPTEIEIGTAFVDGQIIFVKLPNQATEQYRVESGAPVLKDTFIGPRLFNTAPLLTDYNTGEKIELFGQDDPDQDDIYEKVDVSGVGTGPFTWQQS
jgi:hypothetical protein